RATLTPSSLWETCTNTAGVLPRIIALLRLGIARLPTGTFPARNPGWDAYTRRAMAYRRIRFRQRNGIAKPQTKMTLMLSGLLGLCTRTAAASTKTMPKRRDGTARRQLR